MNSLSTDDVYSNERCSSLVAWFTTVFIPEPERGYDLMNSSKADSKYCHKNESLTVELIESALTGGTRRPKVAGRQCNIPISIAVVPEHRSGWARAAIIDIDSGGKGAVERCLKACREHGLWAFAQLSTSHRHDGGHVYIPAAQPQPSSLLANIAARVQAAAHVYGEVYPGRPDQSLRLPLMMHLRAPGGPERFPLLLADGVLIDTTSPLQALGGFQTRWQPNLTNAFMAALDSLPQLSVTNSQPLHKSKVTTQSENSVIHWFNDNISLEDVLRGLGASYRGHLTTCPWHDDQSPSLAIWQHRDGHMVCRCLSANSNCPAAEQPHLDAFNVHCMIGHQTVYDAVKSIVEQYQLGQKRTLRIAPAHDRQEKAIDGDLLALHQEILADARDRLVAELQDAALRPSKVTILSGTPGIGKTHHTAEIANHLHAEGKKVAIAVPSHVLANEEWTPRLNDPFIWQSRTNICTCYPQDHIIALTRLGYSLPDCKPNCPYYLQHTAHAGKITIYQHNHLHLNDGVLLNDADVVFVDESPMSSLLIEHMVTDDELLELLRYLEGRGDPGANLVRALAKVVKGDTANNGTQIVAKLHDELCGCLSQFLERAEQSPASYLHPAPNPTTSIDKLPKQFLGSLLIALKHDMNFPNPLLEYRNGVWSWYEKRPFLAGAMTKPVPPAVVILDGSADQRVAKQLYNPWPITLISIAVPVSPYVQIIQCPETASTRKIVHEQSRLDNLARTVAGVCAAYEVTLDGGVSYQAAVKCFEETLGGTWLHYGGQRGRNDLADAHAIAVIASPTLPPEAITRKARALWAEDSLAIDTESTRKGQGYYVAHDERLQALHDLHGQQELYQAIHRCRPILKTAPTTLFVFSPWDICESGFAPSQTVTQVPHGNSIAVRKGFEQYQALRISSEKKVTFIND